MSQPVFRARSDDFRHSLVNAVTNNVGARVADLLRKSELQLAEQVAYSAARMRIILNGHHSGNRMFDNPYHSPASSEFQPPNPAWRVPWVKIIFWLAVAFVLAALFLPQMRRGGGRQAAYRSVCLNNLRQISLALQQYSKDHGSYPPAYTVDAAGKPLHSWRTLLLPYLEEETLYKTIDLTKPWNDPVNAKALNTVVAVYQCPSLSFDSDNRTTYLAVVTPQSVLRGGKSATKDEITDPLDKTVVVIEVPENHAVPWMSPQDADEALFVDGMREAEPNTDPTKQPQWSHAGGIFPVLFAAGNTVFIDNETPADERRALITIAGGEK